MGTRLVTRRKEARYNSGVYTKILLVCRNEVLLESSRKGTDVAYNVFVVAQVIPIQDQGRIHVVGMRYRNLTKRTSSTVGQCE